MPHAVPRTLSAQRAPTIHQGPPSPADGRAAIAYRHDLGMDLRYRGKVESKTWISCDHDVILGAELACEDRSLNVAAGKLASRGVNGSGLDHVAILSAARSRN